jgi:hypothetical protein
LRKKRNCSDALKTWNNYGITVNGALDESGQAYATNKSTEILEEK